MAMKPSDALHDVGEFIRLQRESAQKSIRDLARSAGVSNPYLSQIERGIRRPSAEILQQIARALEISSETLYVRAGILDGTVPEISSVAEAISADGKLTAEQKLSLMSVYRSFVGNQDSHATTQSDASNEGNPDAPR